MTSPPSGERLAAIVSRFAGCSVLVVGDVMLDVYWNGRSNRRSPEAPVPVVSLEAEEYSAGGAANAAQNLASLGSAVRLVGIVGPDLAGQRLRNIVGAALHPALLTGADRPTTTKTRVLAHGKHVVRVDHENPAPIAPDLETQVVAHAEAALQRGVDAVLVSDYAKGVVTPAVARAVIDAARTRHVPVVVDPKGTDFRRYRGAAVLTPNLDELARATGASLPIRDLPGAVRRLRLVTGGTPVLVTKGAGGMELFDGPEPEWIPAIASEAVDVTGAGDTAAAAVTLALAARSDLRSAAALSALAASIVVCRHGTATASAIELLEVARRAGACLVEPPILIGNRLSPMADLRGGEAL